MTDVMTRQLSCKQADLHSDEVMPYCLRDVLVCANAGVATAEVHEGSNNLQKHALQCWQVLFRLWQIHCQDNYFGMSLLQLCKCKQHW